MDMEFVVLHTYTHTVHSSIHSIHQAARPVRDPNRVRAAGEGALGPGRRLRLCDGKLAAWLSAVSRHRRGRF